MMGNAGCGLKAIGEWTFAELADCDFLTPRLRGAASPHARRHYLALQLAPPAIRLNNHPKGLPRITWLPLLPISTAPNMGIQGLARRLEPYSVRYSPQQLGGFFAIIDGPSLAYHALKLALDALDASVSQSRLPSYADINAEAIRWLNSLEAHGIKV